MTKTDNTSAKQKMDDLLDHLKEQKFPKVGEVVKGTIINIGKNEIMVDVGGITTGIIRGKEIEDESGEHTDLKIGDEAYATVMELENEKGIFELSFRHAGHQKAWENLEETKQSGKLIKTKIVDANKGGLMCKVGGVIGFMPVSQLTTEHYPRVEGGDKSKILETLKSYINQDFNAKIIDVNEKEDKLIVSERAAWEELQSDEIRKYKVGQVVEGTVTGVVDFGAFIEFGENMEGLVHISEIAWQRIDNPRDYIKVGDTIKAKIIEVAGSKISLSIKALNDDPWKNVTKKYKIGTKIKGKVLKVNDFGAFVELDKDIHGLAHVSELSEYPVKTATDVVDIGKSYEFKIVSIEADEHRLGLSIKAMKEKSKSKSETKVEKKDEKKSEKPETATKEKKVEKKPAQEDKKKEKETVKSEAKADTKKKTTKKTETKK